MNSTINSVSSPKSAYSVATSLPVHHEDEYCDSLHVYCNEKSLGSSWINCFEPYGNDDNFVFSRKGEPGLYVFRSENHGLHPLQGVSQSTTRLLSTFTKGIIQITDDHRARMFTQDPVDDEVFTSSLERDFEVLPPLFFTSRMSHVLES